MRKRSVRVDESLKVSLLSDGTAEAEAYAGDQPDTFSARARTKARRANSASVAALCNRWATKWNEQNGRKTAY